jgi:hypothetical protein
MPYLIFLKNSDNLDGTLFKIAENDTDLNNLCNVNLYKVISVAENEFNQVKYGTKDPIKYLNDQITYLDIPTTFSNKERLNNYITSFKNQLNTSISNYPNHPSVNFWNTYLNQLNNLNLDTIAYPLNKSLEQYFNDLGQPSLNILQLP